MQTKEIDTRPAYAAAVAATIYRLRTRLRQSQKEVAGRAMLSTSAFSRYETGQTMPDMYESRRLARALGMTVDLLFAKVETAFVGHRRRKRTVS